jgi:hypothetical protein
MERNTERVSGGVVLSPLGRVEHVACRALEHLQADQIAPKLEAGCETGGAFAFEGEPERPW